MSPTFSLLLQTVVIVSAARLCGALVRLAGQPRVIGEMVAGIALGPSLFGALFPSGAALLFPASSLDLLNAFSQFGLVLFMFLVGLRLDEGHLRGNGRAVGAVSIISMALPFALGGALAYGISGRFGVQPAALVPFICFVGLSLSITAFPVLVRILDEHQMTATRVGAAATACAALNDVVAWIALALLTSLSAGRGAMFASLVWLAVYAASMLGVVRPLLRWALARAAGGDQRMVLVLVSALASAAATEWLGIHPLFGSFFLGALLSREIRDVPMYVERIEPLTLALFLPLFFAFTGLRTDLRLLASPGNLLDTGVVLLIAIVGKAAGPLIMAKPLGLSRHAAVSLAALLNTRGLVELVVLNVGLEAGLLPAPLFSILVVMTLITTAMTSPWLTRLGYARRRAGAPGPLEEGVSV